MTSWINEAGWDRGLRILTGAVLLGIAFFGAVGTPRILLVVLGGLMLVTGAAGFCPAYRLFGFNTCKLGR